MLDDLTPFARGILVTCFLGFGSVVRWLFGAGAAMLAVPVFFATTFVVMAAMPRLARRRRLARIGRCACGYDMRATPQRCPECGRLPVRERPWFTLRPKDVRPGG